MEFSTKSDGLKSPNPSDIDFASLYVELNEDDNQWLAKFGVDTSNGSIDRLNNYISEDIEDMRPDYDPALRQHIVTNRRNFFIDLAIEEQAFSHRETSHPLKRTVATIRYYHHLSLDAAKVVNVLPNALSYNPESVKVKIDNLTELGLDAVKLVNTIPTTLGYNPESVKVKIDNLTELGLDAVKLVNTIPTTLDYNPESVKVKIDNLTELGLDAVKLVNTIPSALALNPESAKAKMDNLTELGLDAAKVVNTNPVALGYNPSKINIAAYSLMKAGLWEATAEFEGYKAILNRGEQTSIFTIPIESLVLYLNNNKHDTQKSLFRAVRNHTKQLGATSGKERKSLMMNELLDKDSRQKMGYIAVLYSLKEKLDIDFSK